MCVGAKGQEVSSGHHSSDRLRPSGVKEQGNQRFREQRPWRISRKQGLRTLLGARDLAIVPALCH